MSCVIAKSKSKSIEVAKSKFVVIIVITLSRETAGFEIINGRMRMAILGPQSTQQIVGPELVCPHWGQDIFAACYERAARVWRPDAGTRRLCERYDPEEQKWNWSWATRL